MGKSVLFVCLGNTCRSPIAEAVFHNLVGEKGVQNEWDIDSAALAGWHVGDQPNPRAVNLLELKGIEYNHASRKIQKSDFERFDTILGMDDYNVRELKSLAPRNYRGQILLLGSFDPQGERIIRDPYCDIGDQAFYKIYEQCVRSCQAFLEQS